jgi:hypothetical protein
MSAKGGRIMMQPGHDLSEEGLPLRGFAGPPPSTAITSSDEDWRQSVEQRWATARDGTRIAYQVLGQGSQAVVLANGLGGRLYAWEPVAEALWRTHRLITWDYRGLFDSDSPESLRRLSVEHHVAALVSRRRGSPIEADGGS